MKPKIIHLAILLTLSVTLGTVGATTTPPNSPTELISQGDTLFQQGDFPQAVKLWETSLTTLASDTEVGQRIEILTRLAAAYQHLGMHREVFKTLTQALSLAEQTQDALQSALVLSQFSDAWLTVGDKAEAETRANDSVANARKAKDPKVLAMALNSQGNVLAIQGNYPEAIKAYQESLQLLQPTEEQALAVKVSLNRVKVDLNYSPLPEVRTALMATREQISKLPDNHDKAASFISLGTLAQTLLQQDKSVTTNQQVAQKLLQKEANTLTAEDQQDAQELLQEKQLTVEGKQQVLQLAFQAFQEAVRLAKASQDASTASTAYGYWGHLYETENRFEEALTLTRQAIFFAKQGYFPHILYLWYWQQGRIFKAQGLSEPAIAQYQLAAKTLKPIQQAVDVGYRLPPGSFNDMVRPVYYELADLLLQKADRLQDQKEKERLLLDARNTIESVKIAELQDYFQDECLTALQAKTSTLDHLIPRTAVLYPIPLKERLVLLVSLAEGIQEVVVPVGEEEVNTTAWDLRLGLQTRPNNRFLHHSQRVYDWMIRPIEAKLAAQQVDTLIVVPDGKLRMIPFSTLHDGKHFLVEKYAIVTTPGLTLTDPQPIHWENSQVLLVGLSDSVQDYPGLPNVTKELQTIQEIVGSNHSHRILNAEYSFENMRDQLKSTEFSVIHMATHGEFDSDPDHTYLLTYKSKLTMDKLQSVIGLGRFRDKPVELLTLSACKTAVGDDKAALGLAGVAVKAGARSAIASLWFVDDEATSLVVMEFYRQLLQHPGLSKAKSLQNAQKKLIEQVRYWHPAYWAPFLLIGNWL